MTVADRFLAHLESATPFVVEVVPSSLLRPGKCVPPSVRGSCTWVVSPEDYAEISRRLTEREGAK